MVLGHGSANQVKATPTRSSQSPASVTLNPSASVLNTNSTTNISQVGGSAISLGLSDEADSLPSVISGSSFSHISTLSTTTVKNTSGVLRRITVNTLGASSNIATVYDSLTGSGTIIAIIDTTQDISSLEYNLLFTTGLTVVTSAGTSADLTIIYS